MIYPASFDESLRHIEQLLSCLSTYIDLSNSQGACDINVSCENLVILLLNTAYNYELENYNSKKHTSNAPGIDLLDTKNKICVQVTSNQTKKKFDDTVKSIKTNPLLKGYRLLFFIISSKATKAMHSRKDDELCFCGSKDIINFSSFCDKLKTMTHECAIQLDSRISAWLGESYYNFDKFSSVINSKEQLVRKYTITEKYYQRRVLVHYTNDFSYNVNRYLHPEKYKEHSLKEYVTGGVEGYEGNYWLLIAAGQSGKTFEAKNLCLELLNDSNLFPVYYEAKDFNTNQNIDIPFYWHAGHIVLVADGYDEIATENLRGTFISKLEELQCTYPDMKIVLTSRRNYIQDPNILPGFQHLDLKDLNYEDLKVITYNSGITDPDKFLRQIDNYGIYSQAYIPFYLNALLNYYREKGDIPNNRLEIYKFLIDSSFKADTKRRKGTIVNVKLKGSKLLQQVALVMQFTEKKELSVDDVAEMGFSEKDLESCLSYVLFHKDDNDCYKFEQNAFQLYYVADYLSALAPEKVLDLVSYRSFGINRIKPEWLDAFELMLSVMPEGQQKSVLLEWTFENNIEALVNLDTSYLDPIFCNKVFRTILLDYKTKRISSSPESGWTFDRKLAAYCISKESLEFFLEEYNGANELDAYLYFLSFIFWSINPNIIKKYGLQDAYKKAAYKHLVKYGSNECKWDEAPFAPFSNKLFVNNEDISELISLITDIDRIQLKKLIFNLIDEGKLYDDFVDFSIRHENEIHDYSRKNDHAIVSVRRDEVIAALSNVTKYESIKKVWMYYPIILERDHNYRDSDVNKIAPALLQNTARCINEHPDLKDLVDKAWLADFNKRHSLYCSHEDEGVFSLFNDFMTANKASGEVKSLIDQLRKTLQDKTSKDETVSLAKLFIRLNPGEITELSKDWGDDAGYRNVLLGIMNYAPSNDLRCELQTLAKNKYADFFATLRKQPDYNLERKHDKEIAFNRKLFLKYVADVLDKYVVSTHKELRLQFKEDEELKLNTYLWQYLNMFQVKDSDDYDIDAVRKSLRSKAYHAMFVVNISHNSDQDILTDKQIKILKESVEYLFKSKGHSMNYSGHRICTDIIAKYGFDFKDFDVLKYLPYAGEKPYSSTDNAYPDFYAYSIDKYGIDKVKPHVIKFLKEDTSALNRDTLDLSVQYASQYSFEEAFGDILLHICNVRYPSNLADRFYRHSGHKAKQFFMNNFEDLPVDAQLYVIKKFANDDNSKDWLIDAIKRNIRLYNSEQYIMVIKWLVYLGDDNALNDYLDAIKKNNIALLQDTFIPRFNYSDTKYLPQILELLQLTWDFQDSYNMWYSRLQETIKLMACQSKTQFQEVITALEKLVKSDSKYNDLNYFIGDLQCNYGPQVAGAKPMTVREAIKIINDI